MTYREVAFEDAIEATLIGTGGYTKGVASFDPEFGLFPEDVVAFIRASQPTKWQGRRRML